MNKRVKKNKGFLMLELLLAMTLLSFFTLSLLQANLMVSRARSFNKARMIATEIAGRTLEQYASLNPINLSNANNLSDTVSQGGYSFSRSVVVTIQSDNTRQVVVSVSNSRGHKPTSVSLTGIYSMWGSL